MPKKKRARKLAPVLELETYLSENELAKRLQKLTNRKWDRTTMWRYRQMGIPYIKLGSQIFYIPEEVDQWIRTHCRVNRSNRKKKK